MTNIATANRDILAKIDLDNNEALIICQTHLEKAMQLARATFIEATEAGYAKGVADSLLVQAQVNHYYANYETALLQLGKALAIFDTIGDDIKRSRTFHTMGITFRQIGDFSSAIDAFSKALVAAKSSSDALSEMRALNGLASIYGNSHQHGVALNYLQEALAIAHRGNYQTQEAVILGNLCYEYNALGQREMALKFGLDCWALYQQMESPHVAVVNACIRISEVYYDLKNYQEALHFANQGLALAHGFNARNDIVQLLHTIGSIHADMGREDEAMVYVQEAIALAKQYDVETSNYALFFFASRLYKNRQEYDKALAALEKYHEMRLALYNEESEAKMHQLEARYKVEAARKDAEFYHLRSQELEALREQDQHYYERLNTMKDKFIREASHDLKNPLAIILLNVSIAEKTIMKDPSRALESLQQIRHQTLRSKGLVTELLDLAWLETGRAIEGKPIAIMPLVAGLVEDMQSLATEKNIALTFTPYVPPHITIVGDDKQLTRVIDNLLSNAIKYTPTGGSVTVEIVTETGEDGQDVVVRIIDTGIGLTPEQMELVFEPFYKAHDDSDSDSTGLGLTIVQTIIKQHGGKMLVESNYGKGSMFGFRLAVA
jgi:signal transduction histidine kinase